MPPGLRSRARAAPRPRAPRRRPLWRLFIAPALLLVVAAAWSAFWFYAASEVGVRADAWAAQEAKAGRVYSCGKRSVAGFPFRFEVRCDDASVALFSQTAGAQALFTARLGRPLELVGADLDLLPERPAGVSQLLVVAHQPTTGEPVEAGVHVGVVDVLESQTTPAGDAERVSPPLVMMFNCS